MRSFTQILSLLALSSAAASATNLLPALPLEAGMSLSKRVVQCKGDVFCPDGYTCMTGSNGVPGCCPNGQKCSGPGAVETIVATTVVAVDYTAFTTYVHTQTGVYTGAPETTTTSEPAYTTTTDTDTETETKTTDSETETETETSTLTDEDDYGSTTVAPMSTTLCTTTVYSNATTTGYRNVTTATIKPDIQTGSATVNAAAWNVGVVGVVGAVMALMVV